MNIHRDNPYLRDAEEVVKEILSKKNADPSNILLNYVLKKKYNIEQMKRIAETANILLFHEHLKHGVKEYTIIDPIYIANEMEKSMQQKAAAQEVQKKELLPDDMFIVQRKTVFEMDAIAKSASEKIDFSKKTDYYDYVVKKAYKVFGW